MPTTQLPLKLLFVLENYLDESEEVKMIPKKIEPFLKITSQAEVGENTIVEGLLMCCNAHNFNVYVDGEIQCGIFSKMWLFSENGIIKIVARCKECGKVISVFDSTCDGYEKCAEKTICTKMKSVNCIKCQDDTFSIKIKYEYPCVQELEELEINEIDNAFSWIGITLECNNCKKKYKSFLDFETA